MNTYKTVFNFDNFKAICDDQIGKCRKEKGFYKSYKLVAVVDEEITEVATLNLYHTNATNYACLWMHWTNIKGWDHGYVGGKASGYGYNREEAAIHVAANKLGITGNWFNGEQLLDAMARYFDMKGAKVICCNA